MNNTVQYIIGTDGKKLAVLPAEEFEKMRPLSQEDFEDFMDSCLIDEAIARKNAGEETTPGDIVERIVIDEEHPVRVYRQWRGYTIKELAEKVGITMGYLSKLETFKRDGTVGVYQELAKVLKLDLEMILPRAKT